HVTERGSFAGFDIDKIDVEGAAFRNAKLPATSFDDCVSHSFSGEKKPRTIPHLGWFCKRKPPSRKSFCSVRCPQRIANVAPIFQRMFRRGQRALQSLSQETKRSATPRPGSCRPRVLDTRLHNAAPTRPRRNCAPLRVSSAWSRGAGRERFDAPVSLRPKKLHWNSRNKENHSRCPLSDRNPG